VILLALIALATALAGFDYQVTERRLRKYGLGAELNPLTRYLCAHVGLRNGLLASIGVTHLIWSACALYYGWTTSYALYTGYVLHDGYVRYLSLEMERDIDAIREKCQK